MGILQTESLVAFLTVEMTVQLLSGADVVIMAVTVLGGAAPVFYLMHQMMLGEKSEASENARAVHAFQFIFQIGKTEGILMFDNRPQHEDSYCSRSDVVSFKYF